MSSASSHRFLVAYDITDDRRRARIAKLLERYGDRVQYSVFLVECVPARLLRLKAALEKTFERQEDSILICDLGRLGSIPPWSAHYLGHGRSVTGNSTIII